MFSHTIPGHAVKGIGGVFAAEHILGTLGSTADLVRVVQAVVIVVTPQIQVDASAMTWEGEGRLDACGVGGKYDRGHDRIHYQICD